jgi:hypothetical protein
MHFPDYGDSRLTKDGQGYVHWKGTAVEHYSHGAVEEELNDARSLIARCEHLEWLGIPVNTDTAVWSWSWFKDLNPAVLNALPPFVRHLLLHRRDLYEKDGEFCWKETIATRDEAIGEFIAFRKGQTYRFSLMSDELGGFYHPLVAAGWQLAQMGQRKDLGCGYATTEQVLDWFRKMEAI